jgi:Asp-tRNA(Asn)/Glu-tRNA(Gln) amidotransferase A subunit family amidase
LIKIILYIGRPISILDGIFIAIKDDVDCYPFPSRSKSSPLMFVVFMRKSADIQFFVWNDTAGGTSWFDQVRTVDKDAVCVARLRQCGAILIGKANMHELGLGVTGNNPNHGYEI